MADYKLISQAYQVLSKCGRPVPPAGLAFVDIPHSFLYQVTTPANSQVTGNRFIDGDTIFLVRSIPFLQDSATSVRIQWPDGKFFSNALEPARLNAWFGSFRRPLTRDSVVCPPGSNIRVSTDTAIGGAVSNVSVLFEGVYRYGLEGGSMVPLASAADMGRYFVGPNQNIEAPEMDLDMLLSEVPEGRRQLEYRLVSPAITVAAGKTATIQIPISNAYDYLFRRLVFDPIPSGVLIRPRDGSGYELYSDYAPVDQIANSPYAVNWCLQAGTSLFIDVVNPVGNPDRTWATVVVGVQQKRAGA